MNNTPCINPKILKVDGIIEHSVITKLPSLSNVVLSRVGEFVKSVKITNISKFSIPIITNTSNFSTHISLLCQVSVIDKEHEYLFVEEGQLWTLDNLRVKVLKNEL